MYGLGIWGLGLSGLGIQGVDLIIAQRSFYLVPVCPSFLGFGPMMFQLIGRACSKKP